MMKQVKLLHTLYKIFINIIITISFVTSIIIGTVIFSYDMYKEKTIDKIIAHSEELVSNLDLPIQLTEDTKIYDGNNNLIAEVGGNKTNNITYKELSPKIIETYTAIEDKDFFYHNGINPKSIIRAFIALIKNDGEITQGGSTITQQVIKNNILNTETNKFRRKVLEIFVAPKLEDKLTKEEIITTYCNTNYYGNGQYGIEAASQYYFGKSVSDEALDYDEIAVLVALSNSPNRYNPKKNLEDCIQKRNSILGQLKKQGILTDEQYNNFINKETKFEYNKKISHLEYYPTSLAIHNSSEILMKKQGFEFKHKFISKEEYKKYYEEYRQLYNQISNDIRDGGYIIETSLNTSKQKIVQDAVDEAFANEKELTKEGKFSYQSSVTLINNETNMIEAVVGGRGLDEFNRSYQGERQPGSTIKPILYATAFETGNYYPSLVMEDSLKENIKDYPRNADRIFRGSMNLREAIARSVNSIPFDIGLQLGNSTFLNKLGQLQFNNLSWQDFGNNSLSIGGFTYGVTTNDMAKTYNSFTNEGNIKEENYIVSIKTQEDEVLYTNDNKYAQVFTPDTSYMILDMMKEPLNTPYGTARGFKIPNQIQSGKTGTTNGNKDSWYIGLTDYYTLALWSGHDYPKTINNTTKYPQAIYKKVFTTLHKDLKPRDFNKPETIEEHYIDGRGGIVNYSTDKKDIFSGMILNKARQEEKDRLIQEQKAKLQLLRTNIEGFSNVEINNYEQYIEASQKYQEFKSDLNKLSDLQEELKLKDDVTEIDNLLDTLESIYNRIKDVSKPFIEEHEKALKEQELNKISVELSNLLSSYEDYFTNKNRLKDIFENERYDEISSTYIDLYNHYIELDNLENSTATETFSEQMELLEENESTSEIYEAENESINTSEITQEGDIEVENTTEEVTTYDDIEQGSTTLP